MESFINNLSDDEIRMVITAVGGIVVLTALLGVYYYVSFVKDNLPTLPEAKNFSPWKQTIAFVENRLQYSLSLFAKHGNAFKALIHGKKVVFLGGDYAARMLAADTTVACSANTYALFNRTPPSAGLRSTPMIMAHNPEDQHDLKKKMFSLTLLKVLHDPMFISVKLPELFSFHLDNAAQSTEPVLGVDICKSVFWDLCVNIFFSDVQQKGDFTTAVLSWVVSCHRTQMDIVKSVLLKRGRNVDMTSIEELLENEVKVRMDNGWHPGSDAIGATLNAAMDFADKENISTLVEKSLLTDAWNFIYASNVKLVSACCWVMAALEKYPSHKAMAQTEARNFAYSGNVPFTMSSIADSRVLPFIDAFVEEVFRMYGCLSLPDVVRESLTEIHFENHTIPAGTMCVFPLEYYNFHPSVFPDPETFHPERFVKINGVSPCNVENVATFGFGLHRCPAVNFSKCIIKLFTYVLLRNYDFTAVPDQSYEPLPPTVSGEIWTVPTDKVLYEVFQSRSG